MPVDWIGAVGSVCEFTPVEHRLEDSASSVHQALPVPAYFAISVQLDPLWVTSFCLARL